MSTNYMDYSLPGAKKELLFPHHNILSLPLEMFGKFAISIKEVKVKAQESTELLLYTVILTKLYNLC